MFFRISFKAWHNQALKQIRKEEQEEQLALKGPLARKYFKED